jgi:hypothetical protein
VKPEFVDNRNGNTLVAALRGNLDWLAKPCAPRWPFTGTFAGGKRWDDGRAAAA